MSSEGAGDDWPATVAATAEALEAASGESYDSHLSRNIHLLGELVGLSEAERLVLRFFVVLHVHEAFSDLLQTASVGRVSGSALLGTLLGLEERDVSLANASGPRADSA